MKFPKTLIICGIPWRIVFDKKESGGAFYWHEHCIRIATKQTDERKFQILIHEIAEAIMVTTNMRFQKCLNQVHNGDYLFSFDHDRFEAFTDELSGVLKQFGKGR